VVAGAGQVAAVRAAPLVGIAAGTAGQAAATAAGAMVCTGPNPGAVKVAKTHGCVATVSGMPLPPVSPDRMIWRASPL
jgi:hypothetical protein